MSDDLIKRLEARAKAAHEEGNMTADCDAQHFEEAAARIRALEAQGVTVKPLEWEDWSARHRNNFTAITPFGRYSVFQLYFPEMHHEIKPPHGKPLSAGTLGAAKAAAQADYERRIRSALTPASVTDEALEPIDRALRHIEGCLTFPVSTEINERGYNTRTPTPETVQYMVDLVIEARAALSALAGQGGE